jgi:hypothetical protein
MGLPAGNPAAHGDLPSLLEDIGIEEPVNPDDESALRAVEVRRTLLQIQGRLHHLDGRRFFQVRRFDNDAAPDDDPSAELVGVFLDLRKGGALVGLPADVLRQGRAGRKGCKEDKRK